MRAKSSYASGRAGKDTLLLVYIAVRLAEWRRRLHSFQSLAHLAFWPANAGLVCCYTHVCAHVCVYACAYVAHMHAQSLKVHVQSQAPTQPPAQPSNGHHHSLATTMTAAAVVSAACNLHQVLSVCQNALLFRCSHQSYRPHLPYHSIRASRVMAASRAPQRDTTGSHCVLHHSAILLPGRVYA